MARRQHDGIAGDFFAIQEHRGFDFPAFEMDIGKFGFPTVANTCLLYTSDAADERSSVDLGGRRIIKKKKSNEHSRCARIRHNNKKII